MRHDQFGDFLVDMPETGRERVRGLKGRDALAPREGLLLRRCRSVHTFGMRFAIDAVLLDRDDRILAVVRLPPGRLLLPRPGVRSILEVAAGGGALLSPEPRVGSTTPGDPGTGRLRRTGLRARRRTRPGPDPGRSV
jgi:uncharacterized membrane protein (UPF0127 family)